MKTDHVIKTFQIKMVRDKDDGLGLSKSAMNHVQASLLSSFLKAMEETFEKDKLLPTSVNITIKYAIGGIPRE